MPRTRIHNLNISLDGYAAGEHVTFDARSAVPSGSSPGSMVTPSTGSTRWMPLHASALAIYVDRLADRSR